MTPIVVIPSRMAATRLPGKPLADIHGKPMIVQVLDRGREAEIGPVAVMHKNRLIQAGNQTYNEFVDIDPAANTEKPKLLALVDALNALKVPAADVIDIIKMLKHKRALFGELIIE